jgi:hypothetical protein
MPRKHQFRHKDIGKEAVGKQIRNKYSDIEEKYDGN